MRVLLLSNQSAFSAGIGSLLCQEAGLDVVVCDQDPQRAIECIKEVQPDVVVVDSSAVACHPIPTVVRILGEGMGTRIVELSLVDKAIRVYQGRRLVVEDVKDILAAIGQSAVCGASKLGDAGG